MLRRIVPLSLAMTVCVSFIPTKANAATLTLLPVDYQTLSRPETLQKKTGDLIAFALTLNPASSFGGVDAVHIINISEDYDSTELSRPAGRVHYKIGNGYQFSTEKVIAYFFFEVNKPVKDGLADITATVTYQVNRESIFSYTFTDNSSLDVQPVPEPLTILGAATALGYGVILKRKSSKKTGS
jgi:hypothetical protein